MTTVNQRQGRLFVLSAPSGSGKSTIKDKILSRFSQLVYSVSFTTRKPRPGEKNARDYNFVSEECFKKMIAQGDFLEWAQVFGCYYGTCKAWVEERLNNGFDVLADLDVKGAASVKSVMPEATLIFLIPPTAAELKKRLNQRHTETEEEVRLRLSRIWSEIDCRKLYDYLVVNDVLERAVDEMAGIITERRGRGMAESESFWPYFFDGCEGSL